MAQPSTAVDFRADGAPLRQAEWFEKVAYQLDNGEAVAAAVPWTPPVAKVAGLADLLALVTAIERGAPNTEPWSPKLSEEARSVGALLLTHGFVGVAAQKAVMARLHADHGVEVAKYRNPRNRALASGLQANGLPAAVWEAA